MTHHANRGAGTFFSASTYIFNDKRLSDTAKLVFLALSAKADYKTGQIEMSRARIAELTSLSSPTVGKAINQLEETGWLHRLSASVYAKGANRYTLHVIPHPELEKKPVDNGKSALLAELNTTPKPEKPIKEKPAEKPVANKEPATSNSDIYAEIEVQAQIEIAKNQTEKEWLYSLSDEEFDREMKKRSRKNLSTIYSELLTVPEELEP